MKTKILGGVVTIGVFPRRRRNCGWCEGLKRPSQVGLFSWQPIPVLTPCGAFWRTSVPTRGTSADSATKLRQGPGKIRRY